MSYVSWINNMNNQTFCESGQGIDTMLMVFFDEFKEFTRQVDQYENKHSNVEFKNTFSENGHISFSITVKDNADEFMSNVQSILDREEFNNKVEVTQLGDTFTFTYVPQLDAFQVSLLTS